MFEVGDEVLIKAKVLKTWSKPFEYICEVGNGFCKRVMAFPDDCIMHERTYEQGVTEGRDSVWELAKRFAYGDLSNPDKRRDIFGNTGLFACMNPKNGVEEVIFTLESYEKEKEIKPTDIVEYNGKNWVVTEVYKGEYSIWNGKKVVHTANVKKVGSVESIKPLEELLRQIGE